MAGGRIVAAVVGLVVLSLLVFQPGVGAQQDPGELSDAQLADGLHRLGQGIDYEEHLTLSSMESGTITIQITVDPQLLDSEVVAQLLAGLGSAVPRTEADLKSFAERMVSSSDPAKVGIEPVAVKTYDAGQGKLGVKLSATLQGSALGDVIANEMRDFWVGMERAAESPDGGKRADRTTYKVVLEPFKGLRVSEELYGRIESVPYLKELAEAVRAEFRITVPGTIGSQWPGEVSQDRHGLTWSVPLLSPAPESRLEFIFTSDYSHTKGILLGILYFWILGALAAFLLVALKKMPRS